MIKVPCSAPSCVTPRAYQGPKLSKTCMSKAREMVKVMQEGENLEGDDDEEAEGEDLAASIMRWMNEQDPKLTESH